jgi:hypothetical protein
MTAIIQSLDNFTPIKQGDNGHIEFTWSTHIKEKILQFTFQSVRMDTDNLSLLEGKLEEILTELKNKYDNLKDENSLNYLITLFKFIGYTRDIIEGKGEYQLTYMMIYTWSKYYPNLARIAIQSLVRKENDHILGSWKDIKLFCDYCRIQQSCQYNPNSKFLIPICISLMNSQLKHDLENYEKNQPISLAARWVPREKSKYGWLFQQLATEFFSEYFQPREPKSQVAVKKAFTKYRQLCSKLNKYLDTVQIKQCDNNWKSIHFKNVTSITLSKQKRAFLKTDINQDRKICAQNFRAFIEKNTHDGKEMNGKRIGIEFFTKDAIRLLNEEKKTGLSVDLQIQMDILNSIWRSNSINTKTLNNFIPMVDVSFSMDGLPKEIAIALGIRIAEKSTIGKRVMTFAERPSWVNLEPYNDFVSMVEMVSKSVWGGTTNFYLALDMILDAAIQSKLSYEDIQDMVLVILSDMQINQADGSSTDNNILVDMIRKKYENIGMKHYGKPIKPPHIILWNLRSTNGFPCLHFYENITMVSGYSPVLLNSLCNDGLKGLNQFTPWIGLQNSIKNKRYDYLEQSMKEYLVCV